MSPKSSNPLSLAGVVGSAIAAACCVGLPAAAALLGGLGIAALLAGSAAVLIAGVLGVVVGMLRARRRRWAADRGRARPW